jgi:DNA integrity scanning protein DisA with diadenylate cyclase activity
MSINELLEMVNDARDLLIDDYKKENKTNPKDEDLFIHLKNLYKEKLQDTIIDSFSLYDVDFEDDFYKLLLIFASKRK